MTIKSASASAACDKIVLATSVSLATIWLISTFNRMAGEMLRDIRPGEFFAFPSLAGHDNNLD